MDEFCGQYDTDPGNIIPDCASKSCLNVEANLSSSGISKRGGFQKVATFTVSTSPVTGSAYFRDSAGDDIIVVCNDHYCSSSKNGAAFASFYSTASISATQYSFVSWNGALYGADNAHDAVWKYDGLGFTNPANIPACSILALDQDRMICANTIANPNRVNYSKSGDFTTWATGVNSPDPFFDDIGTSGDQVSGVSYWQGVLYIFKQYSVTACLPGDQYSTQCTVLTNVTGTTSNQAIVQAPDGLYFQGSDGNYWKYDGFQFNIISLKIFNTIKSFASGSNGFNIQTGQPAWQAGNQSPSNSWNSASIVGSIFPSTWSAIPLGIRTTDWAMVDVDTTAINTTYLDNQDGVSVKSIWTVKSGAVTNTNNSLTGSTGAEDDIAATVLSSTGVWSFVFQSTSTTANSFYFIFYSSNAREGFVGFGNDNAYTLFLDGPGDTGSGGLKAAIFCDKFGANCTNYLGGTFRISSSTTGNYFDGNAHTFRISRSTNGYMEVWADGVLNMSVVNNDLISSTYTAVKFNGSGSQMHLSNVKFPGFYQSQVSTPYNVGFSTPVWGPYSVTLTSATSSSITFNAQFSTAATGPWSNLIAQTNGPIMKIASSTMSYVRDQLLMASPTSAFVASVSSVSMQAASTGTFVTQCINIPSTISKWGALNCSIQTSGNGSLVFFSSSAATCAGLPTSTMTAASQWTSTPNNGTIPISTNSVIAIRFDSSLTSSTDTAQVNSCTINFFTGTPPPPVWGIYNPINNAIYWSGDINTSTTTNRWFKYDLNNQGFWPFDVPAQAPLFYKNTLYFGSGAGGFWYQFAPTGVNSDDGQAINSFWISKDWNLGEAFQEKNISAVSLVALNQGSGSLTVTEAADGGPTNQFTVNIGTSATTNYIRDNYALPIGSPYTFFNVEFSNNAASNPWSILGYRMDYVPNPWRPLGPP